MNTIRASLVMAGLLGTMASSDPGMEQQGHRAARRADFIGNVVLAAGEDKPKPSKEKKHRGKFTIGKETTYVTEPLDKDGYIDYAAALNERLGKGVTPDKNANVLLWKALGPHPEGATMPAEFFKLMGTPAPPEKGEYFIDFKEHLKNNLKIDVNDKAEEIDDQLNHCTRWSWTAKDYPNVASWLKANEKPLALVVEATKRPQYFSPVVPAKTAKRSSGGLVGAPIPGVQRCRALAQGLTARAMLRVSQRADQNAWQDLLACHRLGRLIGRRSTLIEGLVGMAIDGVASKADLAFLDHTKPTGKRIENYLRDLQQLPPLAAVADMIDLGERFFWLDSVMLIDRYGIRVLEGLSGPGEPKSNPLGELPLVGIDWDTALRNGNHWYTRMAAAMREKDRGLRLKKLAQIDEDVKSLKTKLQDPAERARLLLGGASARGELFGDIMIQLLVPAVRKVYNAGERTQQFSENVALAFALAWYQRDHGHYPKKLDELTPKYLAQAPSDRFSGKSLIYRPSEKGYLLYSVGPNGKDEGGRGYDDDPPGDDVSVRMPLPELP